MSEHGHGHDVPADTASAQGTDTAAAWDARYRDARSAGGTIWSRSPNAWVEATLADLPPGRALDLGAGEGRNALWLAARGWRVTAVDYAEQGVATGRSRAESEGLELEWVVADLREWRTDARFDLVLLSFVHIGAEALATVVRAAPLAPGGTLAIIGHDRTNTVGGPPDRTILLDPDELTDAAAALEIVTVGRVERPTPEGVALDTVLVARAPA
ncbi:class I SAM-dependent methyltransferase [Galbitalea sp. SE-J8]|uniref:class I SAM-dependent methyltransferase n=1 Tax=Galbitalea sp. SE-J8 TaxID=3054952 RepID=UPI00259CC2B1|nr:class I SAM-dependent methyltransferase [Galbitalea sp. SE-J8]MDM4762119.1 class I SAM-dependent methyltransferase [Galbitalea sp. SE-J8]